MSRGYIGPPWWLMARGTGSYRTASGSIVEIDDAAVAQVKGLRIGIDPVQAGTGDPSPDNVRPISGWSAVNVWRTGVNVWDEEWELGWWNYSTGVFTPSSSYFGCKNKIRVLPKTTYFFQCPSVVREVQYYGADGSPLGLRNSWSTGAVATVFQTPIDCYYVTFYFGGAYGTTYNNDISINYPSTDHEYHPYSGNQYTIQLGQTVYGGTLDVTNGVLRVDRVMEQFQWGDYARTDDFTATTRRVFTISDIATYPASSNTRPYCNVSKWLEAYNNDSVHFYVNSIRQALVFLPKETPDNTEIQVCYELATPIEYTLSDIEVTTLAGQNVMWADCGDISVEYLSKSGNPALVALALARRDEEE